MSFNTKREHLEHLNQLLHNYPKRRQGKSHKQFLDLEHVLISLDSNDFDLDENQDLWRSIRAGLAQHPLQKDGEALCKLRDREREQEGHWWRNPRNWTVEEKSEQEELQEITDYLSEWTAGDDEYMVAHYFYVLEELHRDKNHKSWTALKSAVANNEALHTICWKKYSAWTKKYNKEDWWWKIGEDHCKG